jgi:hypothetical protein
MIGRNAAGALFTAAQRSEVFDPPHSQMLLVLGIGDVVDFDPVTRSPSSALACSVSGTVRPRLFAVLRFNACSNLIAA